MCPDIACFVCNIGTPMLICLLRLHIDPVFCCLQFDKENDHDVWKSFIIGIAHVRSSGIARG